MSDFKEIRAKVCPNIECKQLISEEWTACFNDEWCPKCGFGMSEEKINKKVN